MAYLRDHTLAQLQDAVAANHREYYVALALADAGEATETPEVTWTYGGPRGESMVLFPRLPENAAGDALDRVVDYYLDRRPESLVGCWSLDPPQPLDLEVRLLARGFQLGWRPCWMWLDLQRMREDHPVPEGLRVAPVEGETEWDVEDLPYHSPEATARHRAVARQNPQRLWRFAAWLDGKPVGHSSLFLTTGGLGVAGLYDIGVVPAARNRGIGKAVTLAACRHAREMGCHHALLNGTGEPMYRQIGFERIGYGLTWWLNVKRLASNPPTPQRVTLAEAVGRGDLPALEGFAGRVTPEELDAPLPNGMTLLSLAAHIRQPAAAEWLVEHGATLDVLSAWDLGWRDRVPRLLELNPELANRPSGEGGVTPLHAAAERNDLELARTVLAASPDLSIEDPSFHSTPLGWARHFGRAEIARMIESHLSGRAAAQSAP